MIAHIIPKGDLEILDGTTRIVDGATYAKQRVNVSLDFFLGEWFLDKRQGIPYFRDILVRSPNAETVRSVFRRAILKTPGIVSVPTLEVKLDTTNRKCVVEFEALYQDGTFIPDSLELIL